MFDFSDYKDFLSEHAAAQHPVFSAFLLLAVAAVVVVLVA
jgi:hypothetical protein